MVYVPRTITNSNNSLKRTALLDLPIRIRKKKKRTFPRETIPRVKGWRTTKRIEQGINHASF